MPFGEWRALHRHCRQGARQDVRLLECVVDHAAVSARQSAGIASEISDNARRRMAEHGRDPAPKATAPVVGSPTR